MEETIQVEPEIISSEELSEEEVYYKTQEDGSLVEEYRDKRTGNVVMNPSIRASSRTDSARRERCWDYYIQSVREGNPNARGSARQAGFSENTSLNIRNMRWFKDRLGKLRESKMMSNSERNLARFVNMSVTKLKKLEDGSSEEVFDVEKAKLVADISKFILTTLGKDKYSTKTEIKVAALPTPIMELESKVIEVALEQNKIDEEE